MYINGHRAPLNLNDITLTLGSRHNRTAGALGTSSTGADGLGHSCRREICPGSGFLVSQAAVMLFTGDARVLSALRIP